MSSVLEINPLTRVEGHGRITVYLAGNKVERVHLSLTESPRLFEALLRGKGYREVPEIICRICALCSTVHRIASLQAVEKALNLEISDQTKLYRELILLGGHIQSHALHLYCLVLPDHRGVSGLAGLAARAPDELKTGLHIKETGNFIQETVGGRLIHPVTLVPGGMGKPVKREVLRMIGDRLAATLPEAWQTYRLFKSFPREKGVLPPHPFMAVQSGSASPLFGEQLATDTHGSFPVEQYRERLKEKAVAHSNAKSSTLDGKPVIVGALARLSIGMNLSPKAAEASRESADHFEQTDIRANNLAQAIELAYAVERSQEIVETLLEKDFNRETVPQAAPRKGSGTSAIEAPRGTLIHSYTFDELGFCTAADVVTPTGINQAAMEQDLLIVARSMEGTDEQEMTSALERLVRAYDPCISCAVHITRI